MAEKLKLTKWEEKRVKFKKSDKKKRNKRARKITVENVVCWSRKKENKNSDNK